MATYYSQGTGLWSTLTNWDTVRGGGGSDPASVAAMDNNTFVIQPGHTITFDIEDAETHDGSVSGWVTGIAGITIEGHASTPGILQLSTTANNANRIYCLQIKSGSSIVGTNAAVFGKLLGGSATEAMPTGAYHLIKQYDGVSSTLINATYLTVELYAAQPRNSVYTLTAATQGADTTLTVTPDPLLGGVADPEWKAGKYIKIDTINRGKSSLGRYLHAVPFPVANKIQITAIVNAVMPIGSKVYLLYRNIALRPCINGGSMISGGNGCIIDCAISDYTSTWNVYGIGNATNCSIQGKAIVICSNAIVGGTGHIIKDDAVISSSNSFGQSIAVNGGYGHTFTDNAMITGANTAIFAGCGHILEKTAIVVGSDVGISQGNGYVIKDNARVYGCTTGIELCDSITIQDNASVRYCTTGILKSNAVLRGVTIGGVQPGDANILENTYDINPNNLGSTVVGYGATLASAQPVRTSYYLNRNTGKPCQVILWDSGGTQRTYPKLWCSGGTGESSVLAANLPEEPAPQEVMIFTFAQESGISASQYSPCFLDFPIIFSKNIPLRIRLWMKKDTNGMAKTPKASLLLNNGSLGLDDQVPLKMITMVDPSTSWQQFVLTHEETARENVEMVLRIQGTHDSGTLKFCHKVETVNPLA